MKLPVEGRFDRAGGNGTQATLEVNRKLGLVSVRVKHGRRVYELPASTVAEMIVKAILRDEAVAKQY